jgi:hypothetical protein
MADPSSPEHVRPWYFWVDEKRRHNLLKVLAELSKLQHEKPPQFILIGALALLIRGKLHYMVQWDIDLLFRDEEKLLEFIDTEKSKSLRIVHYDDGLMRSEHIASLHTAWSFDRTWFNVDYILKPETFEMYLSTIEDEMPWEERLTHGSKEYHFSLYLAHPWDILVEKVLSPRLARELENADSMSVDIRHALTILEQEKENAHFWETLGRRTDQMAKKEPLKKTLLKLLSRLPDLGYTDVDLGDAVLRKIRDL